MPSLHLESYLALLLAGLLASAGDPLDERSPAELAASRSPGGDTTTVIPAAQMSNRGAFGFPAENLSMTRRGSHFAGNSFFQHAWVAAPSSAAARDGLGPLFNTMSCQSCHIKDGRGRPPREDEAMLSMLVRVGLPAGDGTPERLLREAGSVPDPAYGDQIQSSAIAGALPEARVKTTWEELPGRFDDGTPYSLRRPVYALEELQFGPLDPAAKLSGRVAPALIGIGLLDAIADEDLLALEDPQDADGDGVSGRLNRVWDVASGTTRPGRFGWKAEQPNVRQQVAAAFRGDIGITSSLFPSDNLTPLQAARLELPDGGSPEVSDEILDLVTFYCKTLAVPARRSPDDPVVVAGERHFRAVGCASCHVPAFTTGSDPLFPELSGQRIFPYTDLALHDMGPGLADERPVFEAGGSEWRTPPLWGLGLVYLVNRHTFFLHDGRARDLEEAVLWHGGEAQAAADAYRALEAEQRRALLAFLKSL